MNKHIYKVVTCNFRIQPLINLIPVDADVVGFRGGGPGSDQDGQPSVCTIQQHVHLQRHVPDLGHLPAVDASPVCWRENKPKLVLLHV